MRVLLDTHVLLWALEDRSRLSERAAEALLDPGISKHVSPVSAYEICLKYRLGRLPGAKILAENFNEIVGTIDCLPLPVTLRHAAEAGALDPLHRDPFDRLLIAQSMAEAMPLISKDSIFDRFGVERLW